MYKTDDDNGYILTNHHVIENCDEIRVVFTNDEKVDVEIIAAVNDNEGAKLALETLEHGTDGVIFEANDFNKTKKIAQEVIEASQTKYELKTATITIGAGETGVRYLFVRTVFDNADTVNANGDVVENTGNESEYTVTHEGVNYKLVGTYIFDNTGPVVSFNPNGETVNWKQEQTSEVTVKDNENAASNTTNASGEITANTNQGTGVAGVKTSTIKYCIVVIIQMIVSAFVVSEIFKIIN